MMLKFFTRPASVLKHNQIHHRRTYEVIGNLVKIIDVSKSATKKTVSKYMVCHLTDLLEATDLVPPEYKPWISLL